MAEHITNLKDWIPEFLSAIVVSAFVGGVMYRWLIADNLSSEMMTVFLVVVLASLATIVGVDTVKQFLS
jgi:protein-S-isoprenylcysteine O-methyltransferase Ste14